MKGLKLATMAWRNIWRNRRRTVITLFGIAFGVMLAVVATGIGDSSYSKMIDYAARMGAGHVTVQHPEYVELPSLKKTVTRTAAIIEAAKAEPEVTTAVPRVTGAVMLATAHGSYGSGFIALDPAQESTETLEILDDIAEGSFFETSRDKGIILGAKLAENLEVELGKRVVFTMTDKHGEIVSGLARVSGIVRSGAPSLDAGLCLLPLDVVRDALGYAPDEATQVAIYVRDNRDAEAVASRIDGALTWMETQPDLYAFISMKVNGTIVMEVIIMLLIGAGIFNSLFVSVMERLREFGVMLAIGFQPAQVFALVMWESLWIALAGLVAAVVVTAGPYYHLATNGLDMSKMMGGSGQAEISGVAFDPQIYVGIYPESAVMIGVIVLLAVLSAGLYPAWKAGRVEPVDAIKLV